MRDDDIDEAPLYRIGREALGPALCLHIHRLIHIAGEERVGRVFFLAREGHLLQRIYDRLVTLHRGPRPACRYLQVSRRSTALPDDDARDRLVRYLAQEGFFLEQHVALVDLGWSGTIQDNLTRAIDGVAGAPTLRGLYFGLFCDEATRGVPLAKRGLVYDTRYDRGLRGRAPLHFVQIFELACRPSEGMTIGYAEEDGAIRPVCETSGPERQGELRAHAAVAQLQAGILEAADHHVERYADATVARLDSLRDEVQGALERLIFLPAPDELRALGELCHAEEWAAASWSHVVGATAPARLLSPRRWIDDFYRSCWKPGYLAAMGGRPLCTLFRHYERAKLAVARG